MKDYEKHIQYNLGKSPSRWEMGRKLGKTAKYLSLLKSGHEAL